ncbi:hypothetical protein GQ43DRAFT_486797 [Delitschia confertaspora ATCC 74209]|uniref:Uncharacterized protein n=1 Tax=Delitschia confertaspora ATCC 74209 TaxID=1513339 RepID=A0A9P4MSP5_9PLEO|nr:hypothetical protein GQ43DRAFT_486797 [Delitschia confertaspora ATCC 74209]
MASPKKTLNPEESLPEPKRHRRVGSADSATSIENPKRDSLSPTKHRRTVSTGNTAYTENSKANSTSPGKHARDVSTDSVRYTEKPNHGSPTKKAKVKSVVTSTQIENLRTELAEFHLHDEYVDTNHAAETLDEDDIDAGSDAESVFAPSSVSGSGAGDEFDEHELGIGECWACGSELTFTGVGAMVDTLKETIRGHRRDIK